MNCFEHHNKAAIGICKSCAKGICTQCAEVLHNKLSCLNVQCSM